MTLPLRKRPKEKLGVRQVETKESPRHRKFVRSFVCIAQGGNAPHLESVNCGGPIEFCHVRAGLPEGEQAGISRKPHDAFAVPMCAEHHRIQHAIGEASFEQRYGVRLLDTALKLARVSPCPIVKAKANQVATP